MGEHYINQQHLAAWSANKLSSRRQVKHLNHGQETTLKKLFSPECKQDTFARDQQGECSHSEASKSIQPP